MTKTKDKTTIWQCDASEQDQLYDHFGVIARLDNLDFFAESHANRKTYPDSVEDCHWDDAVLDLLSINRMNN